MQETGINIEDLRSVWLRVDRPGWWWVPKGISKADGLARTFPLKPSNTPHERFRFSLWLSPPPPHTLHTFTLRRGSDAKKMNVVFSVARKGKVCD